MENRWFMWVLIINTCFALLYFIYRGIIKKEYRKAVLLMVFMVFTPVVGAAFLAGSELVNILLFRKRDNLLNEEELSFSKKRTRMIISDDIERESDRVPIEEALLISDTHNRRQSFLELLKRSDVEEYMPGIQAAMAQEDSEVVHYAASYITDTLAKYKETEKQLRDIYEESKDIQALVIYLQFCNNALHKRIFSEPDQRIYLNYYDGYLEELYLTDRTKVDGNMLADAIAFWNDCKEPVYADKWLERGEEYLDSELPVAKEILKYHYRNKNKKKFMETVERIKNSSLVLDGELLEWIRFYG